MARASATSSVEDVERVVLRAAAASRRWSCTSTATAGRVELPFAIVADHPADGRIDELRIYYSTWPLTGRHANRPPLLQPDPELRASDVVGEYQRGARGRRRRRDRRDVRARRLRPRAAGGAHVHRGPDGLRAFYERLFSNGGGIPLEHCAVVDDGRACALEYNVVRWGKTELPPQAGVAVYVRGAERQARRGPDLRRRRSAARVPRRRQPWTSRGTARIARVPGVAQPGRARGPSRAGSRGVTPRRSCQRSTTDGRPQNQ